MKVDNYNHVWCMHGMNNCIYQLQLHLLSFLNLRHNQIKGFISYCIHEFPLSLLFWQKVGVLSHHITTLVTHLLPSSCVCRLGLIWRRWALWNFFRESVRTRRREQDLAYFRESCCSSSTEKSKWKLLLNPWKFCMFTMNKWAMELAHFMYSHSSVTTLEIYFIWQLLIL